MNLSEDDLRKCFSGIRVQLNVQLPVGQKWSPRIQVLDDLEQIRGLYVPWYRTSSEFDVGCKDNGAMPATAGDIADNLSEWIGRICGIQKYVTEFRASKRADLNIPVYKLNEDGRFLILDGNHRCVALLKAGVPFKVNLVVIEGPITRDALPDLVHFGG